MAKAQARREGGAREIRRLVGRLQGGRLSYGRPVRVGDRAVIPVCRVRIAGGFGFGAPDSSGSEGGGGGGAAQATPVGFIDVGPEGARYEAVAPRGRALLAAGAAGAVVATAAGALLGAGVAGGTMAAAVRRAAALRPRRKARGSWPPRWPRR